MRCIGLSREYVPSHHHSGGASRLCHDCYKRLTDGHEAFGSILCRRMWRFGVPLLLLPDNRVCLALNGVSEVMWGVDRSPEPSGR